MKFRSKIVEIEAWRFDPPETDKPQWLDDALASGAIERGYHQFAIKTLEGVMIAREGDWIIHGTEGELYPCKDSVFQRKYALVGDPGESSPARESVAAYFKHLQSTRRADSLLSAEDAFLTWLWNEGFKVVAVSGDQG